MKAYTKDPSAVLDYKWDFAALTNGSGTTNWLETGETISSCTVTADTGLTVESSARANTNTSVVAWLSGGTADVTYTVTCRIVTSESRTDERSIKIQVQDR